MDLSHNNLGDRGAGAVADMLQKNSTLVTISLSGNDFTDEAAERLAQALTVNTKLQHLDLSHNALAERAGSDPPQTDAPGARKCHDPASIIRCKRF